MARGMPLLSDPSPASSGQRLMALDKHVGTAFELAGSTDVTAGQPMSEKCHGCSVKVSWRIASMYATTADVAGAAFHAVPAPRAAGH